MLHKLLSGSGSVAVEIELVQVIFFVSPSFEFLGRHTAICAIDTFFVFSVFFPL